MDLINIINEAIRNITLWFLDYGVNLLIIIIVITIALIARRFGRVFIGRFVRRIVIDKEHSKKEEEQRQNTLIKILSISFNILIWVIVFFIILQKIGVDIGPLLAGFGILGLAVALGTQHVIRDFISGFLIVTENQYRIGDIVTLVGISGKVEDITPRVTTLRDLDGTVHHIPHGQITTVSNLSKYYARVNLNIGVSYKSNLEEVISVINKVGKELSEDPLWGKNIISPLHFLRVESFADSAIILKILGETIPVQQWAVASEFRKRIKVAFDEKGIEISSCK